MQTEKLGYARTNNNDTQKPITTEGMAANISKAGFISIFTFRGASSDKKLQYKFYGIAISMEPKETSKVLTNRGRILNWLSGSHCEPVKSQPQKHE